MLRIFTIIAGVLLLAPSLVTASDPLQDIYAKRPDLRSAFDVSGAAIPGSAAGFLLNLEDWAEQYGWQSYPELVAYAPAATPPSAEKTQATFPEIISDKYIVLDDSSGAILLAEHADTVWPIASITKLMSMKVALDTGLDLGGKGDVRDEDDVGGAKLYVDDGTTFTVRDLLGATIVGSANNSANALARLTGLSKTNFVAEMNTKADDLDLPMATFVDPTGIELGNTATAREVAEISRVVFQNENIRYFAGSTSVSIAALNDADYVRDIKNTNWLLYDSAYDDVYVTAGKTGYLDESGWNLVVRMHPMGEAATKRPLTIVVFGAAGRRESFDAAANLARWTWGNFSWD